MSEDLNRRLKVVCSLIKEELNAFQILLPRINKAWNKATLESEDLYLDSVALNLHGFYSGVEKIFELIAERIDDAVPMGKDWHRNLLNQMSIEIEQVRPPVIKKQTHSLLNNYRAFRHIVRNVYTFNLSSDKLRPLVQNLSETIKLLETDIDQFCRFLS